MDSISQDGIVVAEVHARTVTVAEEQQLRHSDVLGNSKSYLATQCCILSYCGLYLCLRCGDEHASKDSGRLGKGESSLENIQA